MARNKKFSNKAALTGIIKACFGMGYHARQVSIARKGKGYVISATKELDQSIGVNSRSIVGLKAELKRDASKYLLCSLRAGQHRNLKSTSLAYMVSIVSITPIYASRRILTRFRLDSKMLKDTQGWQNGKWYISDSDILTKVKKRAKVTYSNYKGLVVKSVKKL